MAGLLEEADLGFEPRYPAGTLLHSPALRESTGHPSHDPRLPSVLLGSVCQCQCLSPSPQELFLLLDAFQVSIVIPQLVPCVPVPGKEMTFLTSVSSSSFLGEVILHY